MKKIALFLVLLTCCISLRAQEYYINLHQSGHVMYQNNVNEISNIYFEGSNPTSILINQQTGINSFPITAFDSITFVLQEPPQPGDAVTITYNGGAASIVNPYAGDGVSVSNNGADVTVNSTKAGVNYFVTGTSTNGSLTIYSNSNYALSLSFLSLTSTTTAAINLATPVNVDLTVDGVCNIADEANSAVNATLYAAGNLTLEGNDNLRVTGNAKHGILVDGNLTVNNGEIDILDTDSDGIHVNGALYWNGGNLNIASAGSDGLDVSGDVIIQNGDLEISTSAESQRSLKVSGIFSMSDGHLTVNSTGNDGKGIKCDSTLILAGGIVEVNVAGQGSNGISSDRHISIEGADITVVSTSYDGKCFKSDGTFSMSSGSINLTHSGDISKGIKTVGDITISGGSIDIYSSGSTEVTNNDPSYCTAIKGDANIINSGGDITIKLPTSNKGGKGISCTGDMMISGNNTINIETHGDGATYTASSGTDTYSSSCLRAEGNMQILSGNITLSSSGKGGKGIKVGQKTGNTYTVTYTQRNNNGMGPILTISTTGAQVSSGGGGWPPGPGGGNSANGSAKGIKVGGVATIYGGTTTITTTKSGAEGLESKTQINIEGGQHYFKCYDDCINSKGKIFFNGGVTVCFSNGNDAIDSNAGTAGAITIGNGVVFAYTTKGSPEEGFDCDNNNYIRITGTGIGISAGGNQGGGWPGGGGGSGGTITNPAQGYKFYTSSYNFQVGKYYTLSNTSGSGGTNMVTFSFEANCNSNLALFTATGMVSGNTYYVKYGSDAPTNPTTAFHGLYLGGTSSASTEAFSFIAQ